MEGSLPDPDQPGHQNTVSVCTWFIFFLFIEHLGERALAISNITRGVSGLLWVVLQAFAATCSTLVSNMIGEGHHIYMIYCYVVVSVLKADVAVCWTAEHVYAGALLVCSWWYMRSGQWKNRRI